MRCDPNDAAFARPEAAGIEAQTGLTKREYFAAMALQAMLGHPQCDGPAAVFSFAAVEHADALIAELNINRAMP